MKINKKIIINTVQFLNFRFPNLSLFVCLHLPTSSDFLFSSDDFSAVNILIFRFPNLSLFVCLHLPTSSDFLFSSDDFSAVNILIFRFPNLSLFVCLHLPTSSDFLFSSDDFSAVNITSFSSRQRWQVLLPQRKLGDFRFMFHVMVELEPESLHAHGLYNLW